VQLAQEVQDGVVQESPDGCKQDSVGEGPDGCKQDDFKIMRKTAIRRGHDRTKAGRRQREATASERQMPRWQVPSSPSRDHGSSSAYSLRQLTQRAS
jgi:hypothetical protein